MIDPISKTSINAIFFIRFVLCRVEDKSILSIFKKTYSHAKMKYLSCLFLAIGLFSCTKQTPYADLIIQGGKIYTMENDSISEAVAVKDEKIIFVGTNAGADEFKNEQTKII